MTEAGRAIDWQEAYARLEGARRRLEGAESLPPEEVGRILRERAAALARPHEEATIPTETLEFLVLALAGERYGLEAARVVEVLPLRELTPVPCTPGFVLGVVTHRGRILPVLDFRSLFDLAGPGAPGGGRIVAVEAGGMTFGIFADAVVNLVRVGASEVAPPPVALDGGRRSFVRGVARGTVAILDLEGLARDPRTTVNEEVG
jgi:purine-binding chemotaxis protein CheW